MPRHIIVLILQAVIIMTCKKLLATRVVIRLVRLCFWHRNYRIVNSQEYLANHIRRRSLTPLRNRQRVRIFKL